MAGLHSKADRDPLISRIRLNGIVPCNRIKGVKYSKLDEMGNGFFCFVKAYLSVGYRLFYLLTAVTSHGVFSFVLVLIKCYALTINWDVL